MFWSKNKKNRCTPVYPSFAILKCSLRGYTFHGHVFLMTDIRSAYERKNDESKRERSISKETNTLYRGKVHFIFKREGKSV